MFFLFCVSFIFSAHQRVCGHLPVELSLDHFLIPFVRCILIFALFLTFQVTPFTTLTYNFLDNLIISNAAFYNRSDCYVFMLSPRCVYVLSLPLCSVLDLTLSFSGNVWFGLILSIVFV